MSQPSTILEKADLCVKCGLCLPHCPTYRLSRDENESPRGRIALMQALAAEALPASADVLAHLDHCLGCRACERACPSQVPYAELLDRSRALSAPQRRRPRRERWLRAAGLALVRHRPLLRRVHGLLRLGQGLGLRALARRSGLLRCAGLQSAEAESPPLRARHRWRAYYPSERTARGEVALFTGCVGDVLDQPTLDAAVRLLNALGYGVHLPPTQACCGAIHLHEGDPDTALALARRNIESFANLPVEAVLFVASGCGAQLVEYAQLDWPDAPSRERAAALAGRCRELGAFLEECRWDGVELAPLPATAALHEPCTLRNVLRGTAAAHAALRRIPELRLVELAGNASCCGAAGTHMLSDPERAAALRAPKLDALEASGAALLVSANVGCALHLAAGARHRGHAVEVVHPAVLLARQLVRS